MIQRIQSIYLLIVVILMAITAFSPLLSLNMNGSDLTMSSCGIYEGGNFVKNVYGVISVAGLSALVALVNIFLFNNRKLQLKISYFTTFLLLFFYITVFAYFYAFTQANSVVFSSICYGITLPFISLILNMLASRKIKSDEKLVRSLDRIR